MRRKGAKGVFKSALPKPLKIGVNTEGGTEK